MRLLHTSDWHLGRHLFGKKRYDEFQAFLNWMIETLHKESIDCLLIAGDIFDTTAPSNRAQSLYFSFLDQVAKSPCRHVVIIGGNHDSASLLEAPKALLQRLDIHVLGAITGNLEDEIITLNTPDGTPEALICAVPYLRERDIRQIGTNDSLQDKENQLKESISTHFEHVLHLAAEKRRAMSSHIPLIATGHLFAAGGVTVDEDGVRDLYVGSLAHVPATIFPDFVDYVGLGHLHVPQILQGKETRRYSGSPLPMGFGEAKQQKIVVIVDFDEAKTNVSAAPIPRFQKLQQIKGDWDVIQNDINQLASTGESVWIEVIYNAQEIHTNLKEDIEALIEGSAVELLRFKNQRLLSQRFAPIDLSQSLEEMSHIEVFKKCLAVNEVSETQADDLLSAYFEITSDLQETDENAE